MRACHGRTRLVFVIYGSPQLSHQNQMLIVNYKSLTANLNRSQQIQGCAFLSRVEGIFSSVEGPYFTRGNLIIKLS